MMPRPSFSSVFVRNRCVFLIYLLESVALMLLFIHEINCIVQRDIKECDMCPLKSSFFEPSDERREPFNYREVLFDFGLKKEVYVAGLASPDYNGQDPEMTMDYLKKQKIDTIFGLEPSRKLRNMASSLSITYVAVKVPDFTAPKIELFDEVYEAIIAQAKDNNKVAIHCKGGWGRTGTVLAALKLKELSMREAFYERDDSMSEIIMVFDGFAP